MTDGSGSQLLLSLGRYASGSLGAELLAVAGSRGQEALSEAGG